MLMIAARRISTSVLAIRWEQQALILEKRGSLAWKLDKPQELNKTQIHKKVSLKSIISTQLE